jgi:hypothetical protein
MPVLQRQVGRQEYPLSLNQQHMWFQSQLDLESSLWNMGNKIRLSGPLDIATFIRALQNTVDRHEILRTVFVVVDDTPMQRVVDEVKVECPVQDLPSGLSQAELEKKTWTLMAELADPIYDLSASPLFRAKLLRAGPDQHYFLLAFHHLLLDAFYCGQVMKEIVFAYDRLLRGEDTPPAPALHYGDFCVWQQERWNQGLLSQAAQFWREQLREPLPELLLATDPTLPFPRVVKSQVVFSLEADTVEKLRAIARQARTTMFRVMLAAFTVLFTRYTDSGEVMVDIDVSTRPREMGHTVGFFANLLPVRLGVREEETFRDLLRAVDSQLRNVTTHREFPVRQLTRKLKSRSRPMQPLSRVVVTQLGEFDWAVSGLRLSAKMYVSASIHDLWLAVLERENELEIILAYSDDLLDRPRSREWAAWMTKMIERVAASPDSPVLQLTDQLENQQDGLCWVATKTSSGPNRVEETTVIKSG